ncbi:hypothetical protein ACFWAT_30285 [Streptomyces syringium]|uniref:hypothetical protein n=1 Tax=Streptomyces syringium TaxID=76729 RepID=UPI00364E71DB
MGYSRRAASMCALLAVSALSCSAKSDTEEASTLPATKVCNSLFPEPVARQLEALAGTTRFTEYSKQGVESFSSRLQKLKGSPQGQEEQEVCRLITEVDDDRKERRLIVAVSFWWSEGELAKPHPEITEQAKFGKLTQYNLGARSEARDNGAAIYFRCSPRDAAKDSTVLSGNLWTANTKLTGQAGRNARITILNAAARKIARQLGCLDTANLPETFHKTT